MEHGSTINYERRAKIARNDCWCQFEARETLNTEIQAQSVQRYFHSIASKAVAIRFTLRLLFDGVFDSLPIFTEIKIVSAP